MKKTRFIALALALALVGSFGMTACKKETKHVHSFGDWTVTTEATCTKEGEREHKCDCGEVEKETIAAKDHSYGEWVVTKAADCKGGEKQATCTVCGEVTKDYLLPVHTYGTDGICTGCGYDPSKTRTYNTYTAVSPSNWNELTYEDNNDTQIMNYLAGSFFDADYKLIDESKPVSADNIVDGEFTVKYSFVRKVEDVTSTYASAGKWGIEEGATARAWKFTITDQGQWDNGDKIVAGDFVYSMQAQLDPDFRNYRADSYYVGSQPIHGAKNYAMQGQSAVFDNYSGRTLSLGLSDLEKDSNGVYKPKDSLKHWAKFGIKVKSNWCGDYTLADYASNLNKEAFDKLLAKVDEDGYVDITDETIELLTAAISTEAWGENSENVPCYIFYEEEFPKCSFEDTVGMFALSDTEFVVIFDQPLSLLDEAGNLTYHCFYEMSSLPLVHKETYEANKVAPASGSKLYTSTYNSSVESTRSWGPYKLTLFQAGKYYVLEKNEYFYGYKDGFYSDDQYQTDRIECETISDYQTALLKFQKGELDDIGVDVSVAADYKGGKQTIFTPDDYVGSLQLQSNKEALKSRESDGVNKTILSYTDFRKAISLAIDRADYTDTCTTSSLSGFGLFNSMHYYDVAHGGVYRNTDIAKQVLCEVYSVEVTDYTSLDEAYNAITGYNVKEARNLVTKAYNDALKAGDIKAGDKVVLTYGASADTTSVRRNYEYIKNALVKMAVDTPLEGKIDVELNTSYGSKWATDFKAGAYDICQGGWSGAAWDPGYFLMAYLDNVNYAFSASWDTTKEIVEITVHGIKKEDGKFIVTNDESDSITEKLPAFGAKSSSGQNTNWYQLLNVEWAQGVLNDEFRLEVIAGLEKLILTTYYTIPLSYYFSASMISYQVEYISRDYNTFMAYGGLRYMTYKYTDKEWADYVASQGGTLDYKG